MSELDTFLKHVFSNLDMTKLIELVEADFKIEISKKEEDPFEKTKLVKLAVFGANPNATDGDSIIKKNKSKFKHNEKHNLVQKF